MTKFNVGINSPLYQMMLSQISLDPNSKGLYIHSSVLNTWISYKSSLTISKYCYAYTYIRICTFANMINTLYVYQEEKCAITI